MLARVFNSLSFHSSGLICKYILANSQQVWLETVILGSLKGLSLVSLFSLFAIHQIAQSFKCHWWTFNTNIHAFEWCIKMFSFLCHAQVCEGAIKAVIFFQQWFQKFSVKAAWSPHCDLALALLLSSVSKSPISSILLMSN